MQMSSDEVHGSELLRQWRERNDLTQQEAADLLGIQKSEVCRYERRRRIPEMRRSALLCKMCGVPMGSWLAPSNEQGEER